MDAEERKEKRKKKRKIETIIKRPTQMICEGYS